MKCVLVKINGRWTQLNSLDNWNKTVYTEPEILDVQTLEDIEDIKLLEEDE